MLSFLVLFAVLSSQVTSLKVLVYSPLYAASHTNYMARLADTLTEAGHNVTFFTPIIDEARRNQLGVKLTKDVIQLEQDSTMKEKKVSIDDLMHIFWTMDVTSKNGHRVLETMHKQAVLTCDNLFRSKELIEELREREYDVALAEPLMTCGLALFRHLGIEKVIITSSCVNYDILIPALGEPEETSYLPSMNSQVTEKMNFEERLENYDMFYLMLDTYGNMFDDETKVYRKHLGEEFPSWRQLIPDASLHFINSIPSIDFPRPSLQKTIEIGGISVDIDRIEKLDSHFSEILDKRPLNMLISFGSLTKSSTMPSEFKKNLLNVFREEPNCTFIWKYESDDVEFARGVENVEFVKWAPQTALLKDKRMKAFLTHGGLGSTNEAAFLGKPTIMKIRRAFKEILHNEKYQLNAEKVAEMVRNQPLKPKELVVKYVEFVGKFCPFPHMSPHSLKMPFYQRYNYDIYAYKLFVFIVPIVLLVFGGRRLLQYLPVTVVEKKMQ